MGYARGDLIGSGGTMLTKVATSLALVVALTVSALAQGLGDGSRGGGRSNYRPAPSNNSSTDTPPQTNINPYTRQIGATPYAPYGTTYGSTVGNPYGAVGARR